MYLWANLSSMTLNKQMEIEYVSFTINFYYKTKNNFFYLPLTWVLQSPCWDGEACDWGHTETPLSACPVSHTLSTEAGPHPTGGALAAPGSTLQMVALPPLQTLASVSEGSHLPPGWDTKTQTIMDLEATSNHEVKNSIAFYLLYYLLL